jgi:CBS-domain-containing membrane protein
MQARQIMTLPVLTVRPENTIRDAAALLLKHRITAAPMLDTDGELVGMVSEGDLVVDRFGHDPRSQLRQIEDAPPGPQTVAEVMTTPANASWPAVGTGHGGLDGGSWRLGRWG